MTSPSAAPNYDFFTKATTHLVASPCTSVCKINVSSQLCEGCFRTIDEIVAWSRIDNDAKRAIWVQIGMRASGVAKPAAT